jgi:hypothetical protein
MPTPLLSLHAACGLSAPLLRHRRHRPFPVAPFLLVQVFPLPPEGHQDAVGEDLQRRRPGEVMREVLGRTLVPLLEDGPHQGRQLLGVAVGKMVLPNIGINTFITFNIFNTFITFPYR